MHPDFPPHQMPPTVVEIQRTSSVTSISVMPKRAPHLFSNFCLKIMKSRQTMKENCPFFFAAFHQFSLPDRGTAPRIRSSPHTSSGSPIETHSIRADHIRARSSLFRTAPAQCNRPAVFSQSPGRFFHQCTVRKISHGCAGRKCIPAWHRPPYKNCPY